MIAQKTKREKTSISENRNFLRVGSKHKGDYIDKAQIVYIEAYESYSWIYLRDSSRILSSKTIGHYETLLSSENFRRVHRSYLINNAHIKLYEPRYRLVHLRGDIVLPVSHRKNRVISKMISTEKLHTPFQVAV